jgi:hypothetical protein
MYQNNYKIIQTIQIFGHFGGDFKPSGATVVGVLEYVFFRRRSARILADNFDDGSC